MPEADAVQVFPVAGVGEVTPGTDLGRLVAEAELSVQRIRRTAREREVDPAVKIDAAKLRAAAESAAVKARVEASTAEFHQHQINQRPSFILTDTIGDKAVFSGLVRLGPLAATIDAMMSDTAAYATHREHYGEMPKE